MTNTEETSDKKGEVTIRAFYGDYQITCNDKTQTITLSKEEGEKEVYF